MPEVEEYLKLAASGFKIAEACLEDAECSLHTLVERLEDCSELLKKIPHDELLLWKQLDINVSDSQSIDIKELHPVSR
jgi:hypothetical protein